MDHAGDVVAERLRSAGCLAAEDEAAELRSAAPDQHTLEAWVRRREHGEPLAWIIGTVRFAGQTVYVEPGVYVPRIQSEELARRAGSLLAPSGQAVDLCTGSGAIAASLEAQIPTATVVGVDLDTRAVTCARRNGVAAVRADLDDSLRHRAFDVVTAVAPYVPTGDLRFLAADVQRYEPRSALDGGGDGLDVVRRVVAAAARLLRPGGWLLLELGGEQDRLLAPTLDGSGFGAVTAWFDEEGDLRGLAARRSPAIAEVTSGSIDPRDPDVMRVKAQLYARRMRRRGPNHA
jgi:release factor glutamine methyltransferase